MDGSKNFDNKSNVTMALQRHHPKKGTVIKKVHLDLEDPGIPQHYQNMFGS